jgi:ribosome-associated translation inhibitor RaiA
MTNDVRVINKLHNPQLEQYARERLNLGVGRFQDRLASIDVHLRDNNAEQGGVDKTCSIDARLIPRGTLHVQATERDFHEAIAKAVQRLATVVAKTIDRGHRASAVRHGQGRARHVERMTDRT